MDALVEVFREARRVLRSDGTLWFNLGDSYATNMKGDMGYKPKDLMGIPWRVAFGLQKDGWYLRQDVIWAKGISMQESFEDRVAEAALKNGVQPEVVQKILDDLDLFVGNPMPESTKDRPSSAHEHLFLFAKSPRYFYDHIAVRETPVMKPQRRLLGRDSDRNDAMRSDKKYEYELSEVPYVQSHTAGRNLRNVWCVPTKPFKGAHFATAPETLVEPCVLVGTSEYGCCAACGAPYERAIERSGGGIKNEGTGENLQGDRKGQNPVDYDRLKIKGAGGIQPQQITTTGWERTCGCTTEEIKPCVVLDPFMGAATTLVVADRLGRDSIGIELNPDYAKIAEDRLEEDRRVRYAPWHDKYVPVKVGDCDELPEVLGFRELFRSE